MQRLSRLLPSKAVTRNVGKGPASARGAFAFLDGIATRVDCYSLCQPVTLTEENWKCGPDPRTQGKRHMCGGNASSAIKRAEFGMKFGIPNVGDEIKLIIGVEAIRDQ